MERPGRANIRGQRKTEISQDLWAAIETTTQLNRENNSVQDLADDCMRDFANRQALRRPRIFWRTVIEYKGWTRKFWIALKPDAGTSTLRFDAFDSGKTILEMVGTVDGRGVLLRWLCAERGIVTVRETPYGAPEERLDSNQTPVSVQHDPAVLAAQARQLLASIA
jgi:hypothetical protein